MSIVDQLGASLRSALHLPGFLGSPLTLGQSRAIIRERLGSRCDSLLSVVKRAIYENPCSPYLKLLRLAGCEYGDFEKMVRSDGVEHTLAKLRGEGVYVSVEEFKCTKELVRGGDHIPLRESDFNNPLITTHLAGRSGGTRSAGTKTSYDLEYLSLGRAIYTLSLLDAMDALDGAHILWAPITPGFGPLELLACAKMGKPPAKWFSPVSSRDFRPSLINRIATSYIVLMGNLCGARLPAPEYVSLDEAWRVARWIAEAIESRGGCSIDTYTSNAVRICRAARERGLNIAGANFLPCGEPLTAIKRHEIESTGAHACTRYIFSEGGYVGFGCLRPSAPDDVHFLEDVLALIQHEREVHHAGVSVNAFLFTTLLPSAPKVLLNVENGDYGLIETRDCSCKIGDMGFTRHISCIRGFDKITGEGMTFVGTDFLRIIEEVLPVRFGGFSTDYQIVEEEDTEGRTRMTLLMSPDIGDADEDMIIRAILSELAKGNDAHRMMAQVWSDAGTLRVSRERPRLTPRGKLMPLHIGREVRPDNRPAH